MTLLQIVLCGDSICQGFGVYDVVNGGQGCYAELVAEELANVSGVGPLIGPGFRGIWRDDNITNNAVEWFSGGSWTKTVTTDAFDKGLGGYTYYANGGTTVTRSWRVPDAGGVGGGLYRWRPIVGFCVYWIDKGTAQPWSYSIDGGAYTAHGQTATGSNALKKFFVATPVTTQVIFRAATAAGASTDICLVGIEPFYVDPRGASGLIVHNLGISGIDLHDIALTTSGDRLAWFDAVTLGTGSPPTNQPTLVIIGPYSNDVPDINNSTTWGTDLATVRNRVASYATVGFINVYEQGSGRNTTTQATYRAQTKTSAAGFSPVAKVLDIRDEWTNAGYGTFLGAGVGGVGYLDVGNIHPSQVGYLNLTWRIYWWLRNNYLSVANAPSTYTAKGKIATAAYAGKQASAAYSAAAPISVVQQ